MTTPGFPWNLDAPPPRAAYRPLMATVCVNVRCIACDRSLVGVQMQDRRCDDHGAKCGLKPLLDAYVFPDSPDTATEPK